ncbi:MAG: OmpA family protein [Tannerellaceae bacterium]|jgi:peptidoglycan-associated lipoprotein|nr:OmpA family protein [Tannerellaceae bacterium]
MKIRPFIYMITLVCLVAACKTAKLSDAEAKQQIGEYYEAAAIYRKVYTKISPKDRFLRGYVAFRMGECNRLVNNTPRALSAYMNALRYRYADSTVNLRLGLMNQKQGAYAEAVKYYSAYLESDPSNVWAQNGLKGSEEAILWRRNPTRYKVAKMDKFNSRRSEFGPMFYGANYDRLYFASSRTKDKEAKPNPITGQVNNDFFLAKQDENGNWLAPELIEDAVNTEFDEGTPSFTADGNTMYYTYCSEDPEGSRTSEIYVAARANASWGKGSRTTIVKDSITSLGHPSVSPDGRYLYFVSDAGGFGGKDIFRARIIGNDFGPMENLGPAINTPGDEVFPYARDSVTLYFASDGHPGMGGLDIFRATLDSAGVWSVENMKYPINSQADDFGITFAGGRERGFFSSNRNDLRGSDHLYSFELPVITVVIEGIVSDINEEPVEGATVRIVGQDGLNEKTNVRRDGSYRIELERDVKYVMMASARGFLNQNFELSTTPEERSETYVVDFFLSPVYTPVVVENIFYAFDSAVLREESKEALDELIRMLNDNPNVVIELGAHTDRMGTDAYNEGLAQRRAQSVVSYLIAGGISPERLEAKGYGESSPKVINKKAAAEWDFLNEGDVLTEEFVLNLTPPQQEIADQINRRTEFRVLRTNFNLY